MSLPTAVLADPDPTSWEAYLPLAITIAVVTFVLWFVRRPLGRIESGPARAADGGADLPAGRILGEGQRFRRQVVLIGLSVLAILAIILALPLEKSHKGNLIGFVGIVMSAAIALSSTTFLGNILGGFMLRTVRNFKIGDFLRIEDTFGRVTERGLFHVELQTEDRDLTTLPNLYLVTRPMVVVRSSGTIVSASVSLGYDVPRARVRELLLAAAETIPLREPFVRIVNLGDFSIEYCVGGLLEDVRSLLSTRTKLRGAMLDALHAGDVEIVSPAVLSTRAYETSLRIRPQDTSVPLNGDDSLESSLDSLAFDKADQAESVEDLRERLAHLDVARRDLVQRQKDARDGEEREALGRELTRLEARVALLNSLTQERQAELEEEDRA